MRNFSRLFYDLDQTNKTNERLFILKDYFRKASDQDKVWAIALLSGRRPRRPLTTTNLREWASELAGIPIWLFEECYQVVGDLAEVIALLLPPPERQQSESLTYWINYLRDLEDLEDEEKKGRVMSAWKQMDSQECFAFNKFLTGAFRIGVSQKLLIRVLAELYEVEEAKIAHRLTGDWHPDNQTFEGLIIQEGFNDNSSKPYPFFLAYPIEKSVSDLGPPEEWQAEWKWDGIRSQIIKRNEEFFIWSRGEELVTEKFPELTDLKDRLPDGVVLDGEILAYYDGQPLGFNVLQKRIGRKNVTKSILKEAPVTIIAYDLLEYQQEDIRGWPLEKRRHYLEQLIGQIAHDRLLFSQSVPFEDWDHLTRLREESRANGAEGFMLKRKDSSYGVGRKKGHWWKWKVEPYLVDAVLLYAERGHGRRASLYTDYTFGVWEQEKLVPIAKAYSGLSDEEIRQVDAFIRKNTIEKFGPVRSVRPELVFELAFESIQLSSRHKSGIAVRFPRISRWRHDKKIEEADTLENLHKLLYNG
jgi:DNA ligase-1